MTTKTHDPLLAMNLSEAADKGSPMAVLHFKERTPLIAKDGEPMTITLLGRDSDAYLAGDREAKARNYENISEGAKLSPAELDLSFSKTLAKCTTGWHGIPEDWVFNNKSAEFAECTYDNALKLYTNRGVRWLRDQVEKHVGDRANYLGN